VNNAGIWNRGKRIGELSDEQIERVINVNLMGPMWLIRAFLPGMLKARHGRIINVSSVLGIGGVAQMSKVSSCSQ
jgi:NAD(P)-dependent dehydrogenase (short-subunit alcohol dehydrogenase family)